MMQAKEFKDHLEKQLIPFWNHMKDNENGGFYGSADCNGIGDRHAVKGTILNSRILWFYSSAYMLLQDKALLEMAEHAYHFLIEHCYDGRYGGVYWSVNYDGTICDDIKHTYNQAFAIYALSAYYQASGCRNALNYAYSLYRTIESKCRDANGYLEAFERDFTPASNEKLSENGVLANRTMNTLLHVFEAYTELYKADSFYEVGDSIRFILRLFKHKIYHREEQICHTFFDLSYRSLIPLESYGHNIETSWLLDRGCTLLSDHAYQSEMNTMIDGLAERSYQCGLDSVSNAMNNECENGRQDRQKIWWVQAESVVGLYNAYQRHPERTEYKLAAEKLWNFIKDHVIDQNTGEWFESISADGTHDPSQMLAHAWKCPYHNGRMCMEMIRRLSEVS